METKYKITVPKPCHEDWNAMSADETGRFCGSCVKSVVDFTKMSASEIQDYFIKNEGKNVCGRFKNEQVNKFNMEVPRSVLNQKMPFHKAFLLMLFVVMGSTLFSCKNNEGSTLGEVTVVNDSIAENPSNNVTTGTPIFHGGSQKGIQSPNPEVGEIKSVKDSFKKGKVKCKTAKSESNPEKTIISGIVIAQPVEDSITIEKK